MTREDELGDARRRRWAWLAGAVVVAAFGFLGILFWNGRNVWSPGPFGVLLPGMAFGTFVLDDTFQGLWFSPFFVAALYLAIAWPLRSTRSRSVWPSALFAVLLTLASAWLLPESWDYGLEYQGRDYTVAVLALNGVMAFLSLTAVAWAARSRSYAVRHAAALLPCVWFAWCAFPWLGEMC